MARNGRQAIVGVGLTAVVGFVLGFASIAFACSPRCCFGTLIQNVGPANSKVAVQGSQFSNANAEIRWGSTTGPLLATATGDSWTRTITIPSAAPGFYSVKVLGVDAVTGAVVDYTAPTFKVTASASASPASDPVVGPTAPPVSQTDANQPSTAQAPAASTSVAPEPAGASAASSAAASSAASSPAASSPAASSAGGSAVATAPAQPNSPTNRPVAAGPARPAASQASAAVATPATAAAPVQPATTAPVTPTASAAPGEVQPLPQPWSPSLRSDAGLTSSSQSNGSLHAGTAMLAVGTAGLFAMAAIVVSRRRSLRTVKN